MKKIWIIGIILTSQQLNCATLVYNMKVRRAFAANTVLQTGHKKAVYWLLTALPIWYKRTRAITGPTLPQAVDEKSVSAGSLFNIRLLAPRSWWAELTTGIEKQSSRYTYDAGFCAHRTGFDDVVLTLGKNWFFKDDNGQFVLYGLAGAPTKWGLTQHDTFDPQVGSRLYGAGIGGEISYSFTHTRKRSAVGILQTRFVHFFNRNWFPIIPCNGHLQPGNITDLVLLLRYRNKLDTIECGYNPTFFTDQAVVLPTQKITTNTFVRNSFFANYLHIISSVPGTNIPGAIGAGISIGRSHKFDTKLLGLWLNLTMLL